ncbi:MBL fold metallo-hydrolase [Arthrobacter sp. MI7-26]|uniref:MBL fold metallo-hydrolase n=1 Tax=Arthrobacter sp. MI7-26 TaxID=2993653 RepID=UPI0022497D5D|nr:MBL fold metallo-hydrolase [Arthrobacter sp. MI7-26]MCX2750026.1 MBL fold metallo-hydrolase [Arthrobacter sp. MI7-26]
MTNRISLTKFGHACVRLEKDGTRLVIDPGNLTDLDEALEGAENILVTHQHPDHLDEPKVLTFMASSSGVTVRAPEIPAERLRASSADFGVDPSRIISVGPGDRFKLAGFSIETVGGQHAVIHPNIPVVENNGYIVDGLIYHPGDSFVVPSGSAPDTLLVPLNAPWNKMAEMVDFVTAVRPRQAIPIHDGLLNEPGMDLYRKRAGMFARRHGVNLEILDVGDSVVVEGERPITNIEAADDGAFHDALDVQHFNG